MKTLKEFRWFWAWNDDKEETWLREMAQEGWHLQQVNFPGNFIFEKGEPRDEVYRLDYRTQSTDKEEYLQLFTDAGWEHVGEMNGWQYFRKESTNGEELEIFTDNESKAKKYQRILIFLVIMLPIYTVFLDLPNPEAGLTMQILTGILFILFLFYVYAMVRLLMRITKLEKNI